MHQTAREVHAKYYVFGDWKYLVTTVPKKVLKQSVLANSSQLCAGRSLCYHRT